MGARVWADWLHVLVDEGVCDWFNFRYWAWQGYGTFRSAADCEIKTLDYWSDSDLADDLYWSDLDVPVLKADNRWPLPWPEFNRRASEFFHRRVARKAAVRGVASLYRGVDAACRDAIASWEDIGARLAEFAETTDWLTDDLTEEELRVIAEHADGIDESFTIPAGLFGDTEEFQALVRMGPGRIEKL